MAITMNPQTLTTWSEAQVAEYLQKSDRLVRKLRKEDHTFPVPRFVGRSPRWHPADVVEWVCGPQRDVEKAAADTARRQSFGCHTRV